MPGIIPLEIKSLMGPSGSVFDENSDNFRKVSSIHPIGYSAKKNTDWKIINKKNEKTIYPKILCTKIWSNFSVRSSLNPAFLLITSRSILSISWYLLTVSFTCNRLIFRFLSFTD